jgi:hypothetical protein
MTKCTSDHATPDLFDGRVSVPVRSREFAIRRRDFRTVPVELVEELCGWCGVDRKGGCGARSDLKSVER